MLLKVFGKALGGGTQPTVHLKDVPLLTQVRSANTADFSSLPRHLRLFLAAFLPQSEARLPGTTVAPGADEQGQHGRAGAPGRRGTLLVTWMSSNHN